MTRARDNSFNPFNNQVAGKNLCINGGFDHWQRGNSFGSSNSVYVFTADRWEIVRHGYQLGMTVSRQTAGLDGFRYCARIQRDSGNTSTNNLQFQTSFETSEVLPFINKTMTISDIQKELKASNIDFTGAKKKSDYVSLYITSGLHEKGNLSAIPEEEVVVSEIKEPKAAVAVSEEKELKTDVNSITVLEELVISITIMGHGCEDLMSPWPAQLPISTFFKNNVRVYSRSCVPDVNSIGNIFRNEDIIRDVQRRFSTIPKSETAAIVSAYADEVRDDYIRDVAYSKFSKYPVTQTPGFDKVSDIRNLARASNLSTFLCNKDFSFYMDDPKEKISSTFQEIYKTIGIHVTDIRVKKTAMDGSVSYEHTFNPSGIKHIRGDRSDFNLIYKSGLTHILKDILGRRDLVKPAL
jgi:hypothetical protein